MKTRLYIKLALAAVVTMTGFSSCLKDDKHYVDFAGATPLIELPSAANVGGSGGLLQKAALDISSTPIPIQLMVNLASPHTLGTAVNVKLSVDEAALTKYNTDNGTSYQLLPSNTYTSTLTATIAAGTNSAYVTINITSSLINPAITTYALPLTITDGGGQQISNYKTVIFNVQAKNPYDATYTQTGSLTFPDGTGRSYTGNRTKALTTINATTVVMEAFDLGGNGFFMYLKVNSDNTVTISPSPTSANQTIQANGTNTYDPATKTFSLHYKYVGGTGDRVIVETLKRK